MTRDDRFERDLGAVVRDAAPDAAPTELRLRIERSIEAAAMQRSSRRMPMLATAVGLIVLLVVVAVAAPRLAPVTPGYTPPGTSMAATAGPSTAANTPDSPTAPPLPEPVADPGQVQVGQLLSANDGWVVNTDGRVLLTHSGGATWRDVTPPGIDANAKLSPSFVDALHGWVGEFSDPETAHVAVWRTTDAGVTWSRADLSGVRTAGWDLVFLAPMVGWLATDPGGEHPQPELRWTQDAGITWSDPIDLATATGIPFLPELAFADPQHGTLTADGSVRSTEDGGRTWTDVRLPDMPSVASESGNILRYGLPTFVDSEHGFLTISIIRPDATPLTKLVYATSTAGASWRLALRDDAIRSWSFLNETTWVGVTDGKVSTTRDGGATFDARSSVGLPEPLGPAYLTFVDPTHAWAEAMRACTPGHYGCFAGSELFATTDGGAFWTRIGDCLFTCESPEPS